MSVIFDAIVIGAGPCALAALSALPAGQSLAVVSGAEPAFPTALDIHPKIRVVALESGETPGVADRLNAAAPRGAPLYATAIRGGLANYWGQQFVRYEAGDPYCADIFSDYDTYLRDCTAIESLFSLSGGDPPSRPVRLAEGYVLRQPRLLSGTAADPAAGLASMRRAIDAAMGAVTPVDRRVTRITRDTGASWQVHLSDGSSLAGRKVWLAAGVLGSARIILASMEGLRGVTFSDHAPYMAYVTGLRGLLRARDSRHFNAFALERIQEGRCTMFASIYDMSAAEMNLILASTIGRALPFLKGLPAPQLASLAQPVQIWTGCSFARLEVEAADGRFRGTLDDAAADVGLQVAFAAIRDMGGKVWRTSRTAAGLGFHYHELRVRRTDVAEQPVAAALRDWSDGGVICLDASILPRIGLRPHSLTAMAVARRLVLNEIGG
jgi:hypothetical protein